MARIGNGVRIPRTRGVNAGDEANVSWMLALAIILLLVRMTIWLVTIVISLILRAVISISSLVLVRLRNYRLKIVPFGQLSFWAGLLRRTRLAVVDSRTVNVRVSRRLVDRLWGRAWGLMALISVARWP